MERDLLEQLLEVAALDAARDDADHAVPAVHRHVVHDVLVDELVPVAHPGPADRIGGAQRRRIGKRVFEILERDEPGLVLLELVQIDIATDEIELLFLQRDHRFERVGDGFGVVIGQHRIIP